jgi:hypothetical protein
MTWTDITIPSTLWTDTSQYVELHPDKIGYEGDNINYEASNLFYEWRGNRTTENLKLLWTDASGLITAWS